MLNANPVTAVPAAPADAGLQHVERLLGCETDCWDVPDRSVEAYAVRHVPGVDRAAVRLARLGRPVKKMIGGVERWKDEGFSLASA